MMSLMDALSVEPVAPAVGAARPNVAVYSANAAGFARLAAVEASGSPFQSAGWVQAFLAAHGQTAAFRLVEIRAGSAELLLPLTLTTRFGITIATRIGGAHASFFVPPTVGGSDVWNAGILRTALAEAGRLAGFDALILPDCPVNWHGARHPLLALPNGPAPSDSAMLVIDRPADALMSRLFDREMRKKQRYKRRKLAELGTLIHQWAPCDLTLEAALIAFFGWKAQQFAAMGVPDPFSVPAMRDFMTEACCGDHRAIALFTLHLDARPIAVIGVARTGTHASGMFTAYDPAPEIARFSPGDVLIADLVETLCAEGCTGFDLGVGEARYKSHFCPTPLPVVDIALPLTAAGTMAVSVWRVLRGAKRVIKRNQALYDVAKRIRRLVAV
jgi:CelD/BcsL family acetyltransferase involved in cellulose biosynthesis